MASSNAGKHACRFAIHQAAVYPFAALRLVSCCVHSPPCGSPAAAYTRRFAARKLLCTLSPLCGSPAAACTCRFAAHQLLCTLSPLCGSPAAVYTRRFAARLLLCTLSPPCGSPAAVCTRRFAARQLLDAISHALCESALARPLTRNSRTIHTKEHRCM